MKKTKRLSKLKKKKNFLALLLTFFFLSVLVVGIASDTFANSEESFFRRILISLDLIREDTKEIKKEVSLLKEIAVEREAIKTSNQKKK